MSSQPLEQYLDNLEILSPELNRNFNLIRELDNRVHEILIEVDKLKTECLTSFSSMDSEKRLAKMKIIDEKYEKCKQFSDEKVQLANATYEMVDKHIRRLDTDLAKFECELKERTAQAKSSAEETQSNELMPNLNASSNSLSASLNANRKKHKKEAQPAVIIEENPTLPISLLALTMAQPSDVLDMPVDPNEPVYCLCHQVSYGEMIGCDNLECPIEWFHFGCVGLTQKPKNVKWYCPACTEKRKKT